MEVFTAVWKLKLAGGAEEYVGTPVLNGNWCFPQCRCPATLLPSPVGYFTSCQFRQVRHSPPLDQRGSQLLKLLVMQPHV